MHPRLHLEIQEDPWGVEVSRHKLRGQAVHAVMAVVGESCANLTPYGVGATIAQLGSGGLPNDKKPKRPVRIYGLGYTSAFERPTTSQSIPPGSPGPRLVSSHSAPSVRSDARISGWFH
eukprot:Skav209487  [mRNA]  locus=scaffold1892:178931:180961:+ [translate_table: standard]